MIWLLVACNGADYKVAGIEEGTSPRAVLAVDPAEVWFDPVAVGAEAAAEITLSNAGDAALSISAIGVEGSGQFGVVGSLPAEPLVPGESAAVALWHVPLALADEAMLQIASNDEADPLLAVPLYGQGLVPELALDPAVLELDGVLVGCAESATVTLSNPGELPVAVDAVAAFGEGFSLENPAPITLEPGDSVEIPVTLRPLGLWLHEGRVEVLAAGVADPPAAELRGEPAELAIVEQEFEQPDAVESGRRDFLFYIDRSGSMDDDAERLQQQAGLFMSALLDSGLDAQVIVATADNGCGNGGIIHADDSGAAAAFVAGVVGAGGSLTEAGLSVLRAALSAANGGCNEGLLRDGSATMAVLVSDEVEQSSAPWSSMLADIQALAPDIVINAIAGDVPGGCATAEPGTGYYEAAAATGGLFLSICSGDWSDYLADIAALPPPAPTDTFALSGVPDPATLVVTIDGALPGEWAYDPEQNAIVFAEMPAPGAIIAVSYQELPDCG